MAYDPNALYNLLPAIYRERDAALNYPLRGLLSVVASQAVLLDRDIEQLYNNLFIETCDPWAISYIGDLVSNNLLFDTARIGKAVTAQELFTDLAGRQDLRPSVAARVRADVAKTIYYRRRKATSRMLEELARDVSGWPGRVVEFFDRLGWTQNLEHLRQQCQWTDVRSLDALDRINGAFDQTSHTVDVRQIAQQEGWFNVRNVGIFLWRVRSYPLSNVPARQADKSWRYHFSPLGNPSPLFTRLRSEPTGNSLVQEVDISAPIRRIFFYDDLQRYRETLPPRPNFTELYGSFEPVAGDPSISSNTSFFIVLNGVPINPAQNSMAPVSAFQAQVVCAVLNPWPPTQPSGSIIAVDVNSGRLAIGSGFGVTGPVDVFFHQGFSADLGGGTYDRRKWLVRREPDLSPKEYQVQTGGTAPLFGSLIDAITQWKTDLRPDAVISILDSRNYLLPPIIEVPNEGSLTIEAANRERPLLQCLAGMKVDVSPAEAAGNADRNGVFTLSGIVMEGFLDITGDLGRLRILHSTLVPGRSFKEDGTPSKAGPSVMVERTSDSGAPINAELKVEVAYSIVGSLIVPDTATGIWLLDSISDGQGAASIAGPTIDLVVQHGPPLVTERSTFLGTVLVKSLEASEAVFYSNVNTQRTQEGCARYSYVPPGSRVPRRYRCQPDLEIQQQIADALRRNPSLTSVERDEITSFTQGWLVPSFRSSDYGSPYYMQLHLGCPVQIRTGAEDESEMGVFSHLKQPQRESNLKIRLREYLPIGLEAGIIYVT